MQEIFQDIDTGKYYSWVGDHYEEIAPQDSDGNGKGRKSRDKDTSKNKQKNSSGKKSKEDSKSNDKSDEEAEDDLDDEEDKETPEEFANRIAKIKRLLSDPKFRDASVYEVESKVHDEKLTKARKRKEKERGGSSIIQFTDSLNDFIKNQVKSGRGVSWSKVNKSYPGGHRNSGPSIIRPGRTRKKEKNIPLISVYFDQSGSWSASDIELGMQAINTLRKYEDAGKIEIEEFYFSDHIHDNPEDARREGGTGAGKELIDHINNPRDHIGNRIPSNVIVMTDDDFDGRSEINSAPNIVVPGAVWFLFRRGESHKLQNHLKGQMLTKKFMIES